MVESPSEPSLSTFRFRRRTPGTFVLVPFPKQGRSIRCQGQLEAATARILAACPLVEAIREQPLAIHYAWCEQTGAITLLDGPPTKEFRKSHRCSYVVPDFLVTFAGGLQRLVEVKPSTKLDRPLVQRKLAVARLFAEQCGWTYHVVTERELFAGPLLANIRLLGRFRHLRIDAESLLRIETIVAAAPLSFAALLRRVEPSGDPMSRRAAILHLVAVERLSMKLDVVPISDTTLIYPGRRFLWDPFVSAWGPSGSTTNGTFVLSANPIPTRSSPKT